MLPTVAFLALGFLAGIESQMDVRFVGSTSDKKALFVHVHSEPLFHRLDYCSFSGLHPATIDSQLQADKVAEYAITNDKGIWLPATDYGHEGIFTWIKNGEPATRYFEWDSFYPTNNRSANCLAVGSNGKLRSVSCLGESELGPLNFLLCEATLVWPQEEEKATIWQNPLKIVKNSLLKSEDAPIIPNDFELIGDAGGKMFYSNDQATSNFGTALEECHAFGMRLASPETEVEQILLFAYSRRLAEAGDRDPLLWTSGSNLGTPNCFAPRNQFRWLMTLREIEMEFDSRQDRHRCVVVSPSSVLTSTGCCEGCGATAHTVCEMPF